jgi:DnaK suppressor protein
MTRLATEARRRLEEHRAALQRSLDQAARGAGDAAREELAETLAALERIERGAYGRCQSCAGAIGRQRLLALPAARYCIACGPRAGGR